MIDGIRGDNINNKYRFNNDGLEFIFDENLSDKEIKKLKIKSEYLSNKIRYILRDYNDFIKEINSEYYMNISDEYLKKLKIDLESKYKQFIYYQKNCNNFFLLDEINEEVKNAYNYLDNIKLEFSNKSFRKTRDKRDELMNNSEFILNNKLSKLNELNSIINNLIINTTELNPDYMNLKKIKLDSIQIFEKLDDIKSQLNRISADFEDSYMDLSWHLLFNQIKRINILIDELNQINLKDLEKQINDQKKYNSSLHEYNKLINSINSLIEYYQNYYSQLYNQLHEIFYKASNLNNQINVTRKQILLKNLKQLDNDIIQEFNKINTLDDFISYNNSIRFKDYNEIDEGISNLKMSKNKIDRLFNIKKFDSEINKQEKIYQKLFNFENNIEINEEMENLIEELNNCFNNPFFSHDLRKFNLKQEQQEFARMNIVEDIINKKIAGDNLDFKSIIISYYDDYSKNNNVLSDEELNEILSEIDFTNINKSIVDECKIKVKNEYESNRLTKNQIPIKFNKLIDKKVNEVKKLNELDKIKNNPNSPILKQYLSKEDCLSIYKLTEEKICSEYGLRGSVLNFIKRQMFRKNEKNKSEAREEFKRFRYNRKYFFELTSLRNEQIDSFVRDVELLIADNKIKTDDFNEEFIQELSLNFKTNGKVIL